MLINIRYHQKNKTFEGWVEKNNEQISIYYFKIVFWCLFLLKSFSIILRCFFLQISNLSKNYGNVDCSLSLFFNILPKQTEYHKSTWDLGYVIFCIFAQKSDKHTEKHNDTHTCIHGHTYTHTYTHTCTHMHTHIHTPPSKSAILPFLPIWTIRITLIQTLIHELPIIRSVQGQYRVYKYFLSFYIEFFAFLIVTFL